jgi:1,2-dihydroxy-3-keto-5-methylthiopentene dioxygenase
MPVARITLEHGEHLTDDKAMAAVLAPLGVRLERCVPSPTPAVAELLERPQLDEAQKERLLTLLDPSIAPLVEPEGLRTRDIVVLHGGIEGLDGMLAPFARAHRHDDHETRWIVDGEGVFGFIRPEGAQMRLTVTAGDFIQVPAGVEHWFVLTAERRIKAVRHFTDKAGWVPRYTGTPLRM